MPVIRILSDRVANQIAAGEVIERPAAVVKELVENSLDAGATRIEVEFRSGGRAAIRVEDNGCGMGKDDALLSLERHSTSKLVETADLDRLGTFGFRGEAVPSIASVSHFQLQTRTAAAPAGTEIVVNGGKLVHVRECGLAPGTRITVSHLFNSVPARRKFLKTDATESAHIIQTVRLYALACPTTAFTLIEDGRVLFQSPVCTTIEERVGEIFGRQFVTDLLPVEMAEVGLKVTGLIGKPTVSRATRHEMLMFVNRRPVDSRTLNYALIESYATSLPKGRFPVAALFLELDPAAVDVNVHPAKREVRFRSEGAVRGFMIRAILQRLREFGAAALPASSEGRAASPFAAAARTESAPYQPPDHLPGDPIPPPAPVAPSMMAQPFRPFTSFAARPAVAPHQPGSTAAVSGSPLPASRSSLPSSPLTGWRFLGTVHGDFALFETPGGLVVLDRRARPGRGGLRRGRKPGASGCSLPSRWSSMPLRVRC